MYVTQQPIFICTQNGTLRKRLLRMCTFLLPYTLNRPCSSVQQPHGQKFAGGITALASSASAENLIYGDKKDQIDALLDQAATRNKEKDGENAPVKQKEFYWDQIVIVLVSSMLGLSFLEISIEFFRGSEVSVLFR